jgi:hypothetical protein
LVGMFQMPIRARDILPSDERAIAESLMEVYCPMSIRYCRALL